MPELPKDVLKMASGLISPSGLAGHRRQLCTVTPVLRPPSTCSLMTVLIVTLSVTLLFKAEWNTFWTHAVPKIIFMTLGCSGEGHTAMSMIIICHQHLIPTLTVLIASINTHIPTSVLPSLVAKILINLIISTGKAIIASLSRWTTSCASLASRADRIFCIAILISSIMGTVVIRGKTAWVLGVHSTTGYVTTLAGEGLMSADVPT